MFKWPGVPSQRAPEHEIADFAELVCWRDGSVSATTLASALGKVDENAYLDGVPEEEDLPKDITAAFQEIERRAEYCDNGYPFAIRQQGYTLRLAYDVTNDKHSIYQYLLLATRLHMDRAPRHAGRRHADIDGAHLFEELTAEVARNYFGDRAESMVFGTAVGQTGFQEKVEDLCRRLNEGDGFRGRDRRPTQARDGKLDVVVWKPFTDNLPGKLIAFGQSKTGTSYEGELATLQPSSFCQKWLQSFPAVLPVRMFFVAEARNRGRWHSESTDAGILLDRCRIVDFCDEISRNTLDKVAAWTAAAAAATSLPSPI